VAEDVIIEAPAQDSFYCSTRHQYSLFTES